MEAKRMSDAKKMLQYEANKKSVGIAYLLWFFLGGFGAHRFYLGRSGSGALLLALTLVNILLSVVGIGLILLIIPGIWVLVDAFLIPGMVSDYNNHLINMLGA
jgi:TM2 domain-containing membrane protein YozV